MSERTPKPKQRLINGGMDFLISILSWQVSVALNNHAGKLQGIQGQAETLNYATWTFLGLSTISVITFGYNLLRATISTEEPR